MKVNVWNRFRRALRSQGMISLFRRRLVIACHQLLHPRFLAWVWNHGDPLTKGNPALRIDRVDSAEFLSPEVFAELIAGDGEDFADRLAEEFADNGVLWVGSLDGRVAGYQWSRRGEYIRAWYFPLAADDVVIFSTVTFVEHRGRNVGPTIMAHICREEVPPGGRATADCRSWNQSAIRFISKTGFTNVGVFRPQPFSQS